MEEEKQEIISVEEPVQTLSIFGTASPKVAIKKAVEIADAVKGIITERNLYTLIRGKAYVHCEGWTTMGALLGLFAHVEVEDLSNFEENIRRYRAICEAKTLDGRTLTKAESECSNQEGTQENKEGKSNWEDYALRSMAETRATSKALRLALGWIMKLAGYEATPMEEVDENNMVESENANGEFDEKLFKYNREVVKGENETNKQYIIKGIEWLKKELKKDVKYNSDMKYNELIDIHNKLYSEYYKK